MKITKIKPKLKGFKDIKGFENMYAVNNVGDIVSYKTKKIKKLQHIKTNNGYYVVNMYKEKKNYTQLVQRLVMEAFGPPQPNPKDVIHFIDFDKTNFDVNNLEWISRSKSTSLAWQNDNIHMGARNRKCIIINPIKRQYVIYPSVAALIEDARTCKLTHEEINYSIRNQLTYKGLEWRSLKDYLSEYGNYDYYNPCESFKDLLDG